MPTLRRQDASGVEVTATRGGISYLIFVTHDQGRSYGHVGPDCAASLFGALEQIASAKEILLPPVYVLYCAVHWAHHSASRRGRRRRGATLPSFQWPVQLPDGPFSFSASLKAFAFAGTKGSTIRLRGQVKHQVIHGDGTT